MTTGRWSSRALPHLVSRRRLLGSSVLGGAALGSSLVLGCGGSSSSNNTPTRSSATAPATGSAAATTAAKPRKGGTWRGFMAGDPSNLDPFAGTSYTTTQATAFAYSRLFRYKAGPGIDPGAYVTEGDIASSYTVSSDGLTYTVKLRSNVKWHPPVSRPLVADDVVFSWKRYTGQISGTPANPGAVLLNDYLGSVEAPDDSTVVMKLKKTRGDFLGSENRFLQIMPKETGTAFDPARRMVGTGPWVFDSYTAGTLLKFKRNADWHLGPDAPYLDAVELNLVPEYATRVTQFLGGNLDIVDVQGNDLGRVKDSVKGVQIVVVEATLPRSYITFQGADQAPNAPWRDPRVRQVISMALDRNGMLDAAYNFKDVEKLGFNLERRWNNDVPAWERPYWLDPQGKYKDKPDDPSMTQANQKAFAFSPADAKKLLSAAGYAGGFKTKLHTTNGRYGQAFDILTQLIQSYLSQIGVTLDLTNDDYSAVWVPQVAVKGTFEGLAHIPGGPGARGNFEGYYLPGGTRNNAHVDDSTLAGQVRTMLANPDPEGARKQMLNIQNYTNDKMYYVQMQLGASGDYFGYASTVHGAIDYQVVQFDQGNETIPYFWKDA